MQRGMGSGGKEAEEGQAQVEKIHDIIVNIKDWICEYLYWGRGGDVSLFCWDESGSEWTGGQADCSGATSAFYPTSFSTVSIE